MSWKSEALEAGWDLSVSESEMRSLVADGNVAFDTRDLLLKLNPSLESHRTITRTSVGAMSACWDLKGMRNAAAHQDGFNAYQRHRADNRSAHTATDMPGSFDNVAVTPGPNQG